MPWLLVWGWCGALLLSQVKASRVHFDQQNTLPRAVNQLYTRRSRFLLWFCPWIPSCIPPQLPVSVSWLSQQLQHFGLWPRKRVQRVGEPDVLQVTAVFATFTALFLLWCAACLCWSSVFVSSLLWMRWFWPRSSFYSFCLCCGIKSCQQTQDAQRQCLSVNGNALRFHQNPEQYEDGSDSDYCRNLHNVKKNAEKCYVTLHRGGKQT